jgi:probable rRNA maturation factor
VLCDDGFIQPLNQQWRGKDQATDVLSFPLEEPACLGDVVVSVETARRRVTEEWPLEDEVLFLLIHGLLHLLGHDHEEAEERAVMEAAEQALWTALGRVGTLREA